MEHKYTGRELHMLKTLREIYNIASGNTQSDRIGSFDWEWALDEIENLAAQFCTTGHTDAELDALIAADRKAHGWPVNGA